MSEVWIAIVGSIGLYTMVSFIVFVRSRTRERVTELRTSFQRQMLEKFGSANEFVEFAKTTEGRRLLESTPVEQPRDGNLSLLRRGIILVILGLGFLVLAIVGMAKPFLFIGVMVLSLGTGCLVAAVLSRKLSRSWTTDAHVQPTLVSSSQS